MGFYKECYADSRVGLIVSFAEDKNFDNFFCGDSIQEAIKYFNLYIKDNHLYENTPSEQAIDTLKISIDEAKEFRDAVNAMLAPMDDETAEANTILFPAWSGNGVAYKTGDRIRYKGLLYKVLMFHYSQDDWMPDVAHSLYARVVVVSTDEEGNPTDEIPEWTQPDSANPYMKGDKVKFNGETYESLIDNNSWSPEEYSAGWQLV